MNSALQPQGSFPFLFHCLLVLALLAGCSQAPVPHPTPTTTPAVATPTPISTTAPMKTFTLQTTATVTLIPGPSATSQASHCPTVLNSLPIAFLTQGKIIYHTWGDKTFRPKWFGAGMEVPRDFLTKFPGNLYFIDTSPDQKWLALYYSPDTSPRQTILTNGDENLSMVIPTKANWSGIDRWLSKDKILFYTYSGNKSDRILVDPFTLREVELRPSLPNMSGLYDAWGYGSPEYPIYNPTLTRVVYDYFDYKGTKDNPWYLAQALVMWDLQNHREIWRYQFNQKTMEGFKVSEPFWSPNGNYLAAFVHSGDPNLGLELLLVDPDGHQTLISDPAFAHPLEDAGNIKWSPDSRSLAFYVQNDFNDKLFILDVETHRLWDPCINEWFVNGAPPTLNPVIWSPDSRQLIALGNQNEPSPQNWVIDTQRKIIAPLNLNIYDGAWLAPN